MTHPAAVAEPNTLASMLIRVGYEIAFNFPVAVPMMLMLRLHPSRKPTLRKPEAFAISPNLAVHEFTDALGIDAGERMLQQVTSSSRATLWFRIRASLILRFAMPGSTMFRTCRIRCCSFCLEAGIVRWTAS